MPGFVFFTLRQVSEYLKHASIKLSKPNRWACLKPSTAVYRRALCVNLIEVVCLKAAVAATARGAKIPRAPAMALEMS